MELKMTPGTCTQCGAKLIIDTSKECVICEYCGTSYVVKKDIRDNNIVYSEEAYFRFKMLQMVATKGTLTMDSHKLIFESSEGGFEIDVQDINRFVAVENLNYAGETLGRTIPNCIKVIYRDKSTSATKKVDIRVHNAPQVVEELNRILKHASLIR